MNSFHVRFLVIIFSVMAVFSFLFSHNVKASLLESNDVSLRVIVIPHPQCNDSMDNDFDGFIDYPDDTDCLSYYDNNEGVHPPTSGGGGGGGGGGGTDGIVYTDKVIFKGKAYPRTEITLLKDAQVVSNIKADVNGNFEIRLSDISTGTYVFGIWAEDSLGNKSTIHNFILAVLTTQTTVVSGIILPTTITTDKTEVKKGDNIKIYGFTYPAAEVNVYVHSATEITQKAIADKDGFWQYDLNTNVLDMEDHIARSKSKSGSDTSIFSEPVSFTVGYKNILRDNKLVSNKSSADLNSDNRVNLVDYSILAFWYKKSGFPKALDFNKDNKIDLIDFSIMAFNWTG